MNPISLIPPDLINSYLHTSYHVEGARPFTLRIGHSNEELKRLLSQCTCDCAIFLTAWNPYSQPMDDTQNKMRQNDLEKEIAVLKLTFISGFGRDDSALWPAEPSVLILGLSLEAGKALAGKYEQNAFIWCSKNAVPQLILLR